MFRGVSPGYLYGQSSENCLGQLLGQSIAAGSSSSTNKIIWRAQLEQSFGTETELVVESGITGRATRDCDLLIH